MVSYEHIGIGENDFIGVAIRHCEAAHNDPAVSESIVAGRALGSMPTEHGLRQAEELGESLRPGGSLYYEVCLDSIAAAKVLEHPDGCHSSPAERAQRTGQIVLGKLGVTQELQIVPELLEQSNGSAENKSRGEIWTPEKKAELAQLYVTDPEAAWDFRVVPDAQSANEVGREMVSWMNGLCGGHLMFVHRSKTLYAAGCIMNEYFRQSESHRIRWPQDVVASAAFANCDGYIFERRGGEWRVPRLLFCSQTLPKTGFPNTARFVQAV